ncbi:histone promoter control 2 [Wilcoxina mikolae CBS 423.85]|nr:histone promoter control 2 [Wilcoxina mikolae CBS 423.85]
MAWPSMQQLQFNNNPHTDTTSRNKKPEPAPRSIHLQAPFDPAPRSAIPNGSSAKTTAHRASATPSIASLINDDSHPLPKKSKSLNPSPTSGFFADTNGNKKAEKSKKLEATEHSPKSKAATANNSSAPSPKPSRPAAPTGSGGGLLGNVLTGVGGSKEEEDFQLPNIYIHVPLNGEQNKYINFAKLAEERYGWAALNPRLAKAKMQMDSGDEMMVDGSESESNIEMGGTGEATSEDPKKRKKRRYQDVYDKEDPFIDDSEMLWEQQAAASKDGFFVYSGPLVPEGEKPQIERADGTVKRGRGRGRGSRGGATSTRGTGTTARKPRITKKEYGYMTIRKLWSSIVLLA